MFMFGGWGGGGDGGGKCSRCSGLCGGEGCGAGGWKVCDLPSSHLWIGMTGKTWEMPHTSTVERNTGGWSGETGG
jgi:hypothetical protein